MYRYDDIRHVHLEPTTRCNAACPMCARNARGVVAPGLDMVDLSAADARMIFPEDFVRQLTGFDFCGAYGDSAVARDTLPIVSYIRETNPDCFIEFYSNGGARSEAWWATLGRVLGDGGRVIFAIDGLADTNAVYRRGVDFDRLKRNAQAFLGAGGHAQWDFIAFEHNEHEIEQARLLSRELGFESFSVKKTARFLKPAYDYVPEYNDYDDLSKFPIHSPDGSVVGYLKPPRDPELVNDTAQRYEELVARGNLGGIFSSTSIKCQVLRTRSVFVAATGSVFPCCWTYVQATAPVLYEFAEGVNMQIYDLVQRAGGFDAIDAKKVGLRDIIEGPLFDAIEASWSCDAKSEGRLQVCARVCGEQFPAYFDQFSEPQFVPGGVAQ